jgi:hypothetical protein
MAKGTLFGHGAIDLRKSRKIPLDETMATNFVKQKDSGTESILRTM